LTVSRHFIFKCIMQDCIFHYTGGTAIQGLHLWMRCILGRSGVIAALTDNATVPGSIPAPTDTLEIEVAASEVSKILNYKKVGSVGSSVADPGSGAFLTPVSGIDSRSQAHTLESLVTTFGVITQI
jgi:hypothetical protein